MCNKNNICESKTSDADCRGEVGCQCLTEPTAMDVSGGCDSPSTCVNNLCVLQSQQDSIHGEVYDGSVGGGGDVFCFHFGENC
jgi:hypothetical protein